MGGTTPLEGRVEVFLLGHWGTVCDYYWDHADATVVCHQLGFPRAVAARKNAAFGSGSGPSWYYHVYCTGTELSLNQCNRYSYHFGSACSHSNDAGVVCSSESHNTRICHLYMIELWLCVWVFSHTCVYYVWNFGFFAMVMAIYLNFKGLSCSIPTDVQHKVNVNPRHYDLYKVVNTVIIESCEILGVKNRIL